MIDEREALNKTRQAMERIQKLRVQAEEMTDRILDCWLATCSRPVFDTWHAILLVMVALEAMVIIWLVK